MFSPPYYWGYYIPRSHRPPHSKDFVIQCEKIGLSQARHRVIILGIRSDLDKEECRDKEIIEIAKTYVSSKNPRKANLAILDFTALVCIPRRPEHERCPLKRDCQYLLTHHARLSWSWIEALSLLVFDFDIRKSARVTSRHITAAQSLACLPPPEKWE